MAENTLSSGSYVRPYRSPWGAFPTQTFKASAKVGTDALYAGRLVVLDTDNTVKASTAVEPKIVGFAADFSTTPAASVSVWEANPMVEFRAFTKEALQSTMLGEPRTLQWDSTLNIQWVGGSTAADNRVVITELLDSTGTTNGAVAVRFLPSLPAPATNASSVAYLAFFGR